MKALGFYIFLIFFRPFLWLPLRVWYVLADFLYVVMYYIAGYRKRVVAKNLKRAFPEKEPEWIHAITKKYYKHLADYFIESLKLDAFNKPALKKRCTFRNLELIADANKNGRDVIIFLGHYANWEWITSMPLWIENLQCFTVYKPLKNKYFDRYFLKIRQRFGVTPIPMKRSAREIIKFHNEGKRSVSGLIADQNPGSFDVRYWVKFLNQDTAVFEGGEKIAQKLGAAVGYMKMKKVRRGYYETEIIPMFDDASKTEPHEITRKYFELLENDIRERPELWLWSHKRWKRKKPEEVIAEEL
ncbi:lysophospholipid acyltransferase family protein [Saccharicrinis sp. FJH2]|uniref:lysophospholipid acyltransferase family protein n=1 Tax=Saccharicrinis sp. FJH65 TaxID=3344659 RepID=UPI0035F41FD3